MRETRTSAGVLCCLAVFVLPLCAHAQTGDIDPLSWDFGPVQVGDDDTIVFRFTSVDEFSALSIYKFEILNDPFSAFQVTGIDAYPPYPGQPIPPELDYGDYVDVTVAFVPPFPGLFEADLQVHWNDHSYEYFSVPLAGTGVSAVAVPAPSSLGLVLGGAASAIRARRRHRRNAN